MRDHLDVGASRSGSRAADHGRSQVSRYAVSAAVAVLTSVALAACGGGGKSSTTAANGGSSGGGGNGGGGSARCVRIAGVESSGNKANLDPDNQPSSQNSMYVDATHDRLLTKDNNFRVAPSLATSYSSNKAATVWTFHLRHGVTFQDGKPFTSADVVYTFKRLLDPHSNSEALSAFSQFLAPQGIQARGKDVVVFTTKHPVADFPVLITTKNTWIVQNGASDSEIAAHGAGTGPFVAEGFKPVQNTYHFKANPHYWRTGYPKAPCLDFSVVQESASANAAVQTGQVDLLQSVDLSAVNSLKGSGDIKLLQTPPSTSITLAMEIDKAPFNDNRVRTALKDVVDRKQMVQTALYGYGSAGDDNPTPPTSPDAWRSQARAQNIAEAKRLLAAAGYGPSHPLKVNLYSADYITGSLKLAELYKQMAAEAGIDINLVTTPASTYWSDTWPKQDFRGSSWSLRPPSVSLPLEYTGAPPLDGNNETHWHNGAFENLLKRGAATVDAGQRQSIYKQAEKMLTLQGGEIIPVFFDTVAAVRSNCAGYAPSVDFGQYDFSATTCH